MTNNLEKCNNIQHPGKLKSTCGNVPYVTAGNPIFGTESGVMFNDMLGTTLGIKGNDFTRTNLTAFGENLDAGDKAFFTGKPLVGELGYTFLFRNYRADHGKWSSADPIALLKYGNTIKSSDTRNSHTMLGYPDGWNNLAYGNNNVFSGVDVQGTEWILTSEIDGRKDYKGGTTTVALTPIVFGSLGQCDISQTTTISYTFSMYDTWQTNNDTEMLVIRYYNVTQTTTVYNTYTPVNGGDAQNGTPKITNVQVGQTSWMRWYVWE